MNSKSANNRKKKNGKKRQKRNTKRKQRQQNLAGSSLARSTLNKSVGINRKLNVTRRELQFLPTYDPKLGSGSRLVGSDYVGTLTTGLTPTPGTVLLDISVAPGEFDNTRIQQFAALFERYRVRKWTFWYIPSVPSTQAGQFLSYPDYDVSDALSPTLPLNEAMAHMGSQLFNVYSETPVQFDRVDPFTDLFTDAEGTDPRLTYVGRLRYLACSNLAVNTTYGSIYMEYDIDFFIPQLQSGTLPTQVLGDAYVKVIQNSSAASVANGAQIASVKLETGPTLGSPIFDLGVGNTFMGTFTPDVLAPATTLESSPFTGATAPGGSTVFFKILSDYSTGALNLSVNGPVASLYRAWSDAEDDVGNCDATLFGVGNYANTNSSGSTLKNLSGAAIAGGVLLGVLRNIRLLPTTRFDSIKY